MERGRASESLAHRATGGESRSGTPADTQGRVVAGNLFRSGGDRRFLSSGTGVV